MTENKNTPNNQEPVNSNKHIANTDNEDTCFFSANSDNMSTAEFKALIDKAESGSKNVGQKAPPLQRTAAQTPNRPPSTPKVPPVQPVRRTNASNPNAPLQRTSQPNNPQVAPQNHPNPNARPVQNRPVNNYPQNGNQGYYNPQYNNAQGYQQYPNQPVNGYPQNRNQGYYNAPNNGQGYQQNPNQPVNNYPQNGNQGYYNAPNNGQGYQQNPNQPVNNYPQNGNQGYYNAPNNGQGYNQPHHQGQPAQVSKPQNMTSNNSGGYYHNSRESFQNNGYKPPMHSKPVPQPEPQQEYYDFEEPPKAQKTGGSSKTVVVRKKKSLAARIITRILVILLILFLLIFGIYSCTSITLINKMNHVDTGARNHTAGALFSEDVTNILIIGTDGRDINEQGRSDTMMLVSVNSNTDVITLTSFMRDSFVEIPGYGEDKLNHSYAFGGPELLMDTIELNYGVRIDDYVKVNFGSFTSIFDSVGGIDMEITDAEAQEINTILMAEVNELMGDPVDSDLLSGGGNVHLNGKQALAYSRIRYVGNADFQRTERQRAVISKAVDKLKSFSPSAISNIASDAIPQLATNMDTTALYWLSLKLPFLINDEMQQIQIPANGTYWSTTTSSGGDALGFDKDANHLIIKSQIYNK